MAFRLASKPDFRDVDRKEGLSLARIEANAKQKERWLGRKDGRLEREERQVNEGKSGQDTNKLQVQGVGIVTRSQSWDGGCGRQMDEEPWKWKKRRGQARDEEDWHNPRNERTKQKPRGDARQ